AGSAPAAAGQGDAVLAAGLPRRRADLRHGRLRADQTPRRRGRGRAPPPRSAGADPVRRRRLRSLISGFPFPNRWMQNMSEKLLVRRAAVLGAGVMGAQIAAHLTNAGVDTVLFDLPAREGDPDAVVRKAIAGLGKLSPAPLASRALAEAITPANYDTGLDLLRECDLVIEAIAEKMDWKQ